MTPLLCFSHLRWDFVYQRPQHLMTRFAATRPVYYVEEPQFGASSAALRRSRRSDGLTVVVPELPASSRDDRDEADATLRVLLQALAADGCAGDDAILWYYTPAALRFTEHIPAALTVYDCMDELSAFAGADPGLVAQERRLLQRADLVFAGGPSLYEAKRGLHPAVHLFPSSIDRAHFAQARTSAEPAEQAALPHPRLGYCGVIDERMDLELLGSAADAMPEWQFVMIGPVVKIDPNGLPRHPNIHWLGQQSYQDLPPFICGWDVCLMPFALNEATRFISPTKMLEYMACGRPSVSTSIRDVVEPYGHVVSIADTPQAYIAACESILARSIDEQRAHSAQLAAAIARTSWDKTARAMAELIQEADRAHDVAEQEEESQDETLAKAA